MGIKSAFLALLQPAVAASSLRAPLKSEIYPIDVTTTARRFLVPDAWKGHYVHLFADGGRLYVQVSTDATADCSVAARVTETPGAAIAIVPPTNGCVPIASDSGRDVPFPLTASTFSLVGSAAMVCRAHLAET